MGHQQRHVRAAPDAASRRARVQHLRRRRPHSAASVSRRGLRHLQPAGEHRDDASERRLPVHHWRRRAACVAERRHAQGEPLRGAPLALARARFLDHGVRRRRV